MRDEELVYVLKKLLESTLFEGSLREAVLAAETLVPSESQSTSKYLLSLLTRLHLQTAPRQTRPRL